MIKHKKSSSTPMTKYTYSAWLNQYDESAPVAVLKESNLLETMDGEMPPNTSFKVEFWVA